MTYPLSPETHEPTKAQATVPGSFSERQNDEATRARMATAATMQRLESYEKCEYCLVLPIAGTRTSLARGQKASRGRFLICAMPSEAPLRRYNTENYAHIGRWSQ